MREEILMSVQDVPAPRGAVFPFFEDPSNLEALTPPWLSFRILTPAPLPRGEGAIYEYQLKVHGLPLRWRTLIEAFEPGRRFVDRQVAGPYALWHHTHRFEDLPGGGTRLVDQVRYRVGWGILGRIVHRLWVRRDLERVFAYRRQAIAARFGSLEQAA